MRERSVRACLITNPRSGRGGIDLSAVLPVLRAHGWEADVRHKQHGGDATRLARAAARAGYDVVVGCGGDGTLSEVVDGLVGTDVAMGALPGGTANLWTREVGIAHDLAVAALQLVGAQRRRIDVGRITMNGDGARHFLLMAGLGLDGAIMARLAKPLKNRIGRAAVGVAALRALPSFRAVPVRVEMDGVCWQGDVSQIVVGNTRRYGGLTRLTAGAYVDDGRLDICLITAAGPAAVGRQLGSLLLRQRPDPASAVLDRAARVTIWAPTVVPLQCDGGAVDQKQIEPSSEGVVYVCSPVAQTLTVLVPRTYNGELFQTGSVPLAAPNGVGRGKAGKRLRVVAVGVDAITAVWLKDGRVVTIAVGARTDAVDASGAARPMAEFLSDLGEGDLLCVKGRENHERGILQARRVTRLAEDSRN